MYENSYLSAEQFHLQLQITEEESAEVEEYVKHLIYLHHSIFRNQPLIECFRVPNDALRWIMSMLQEQQNLRFKWKWIAWKACTVPLAPHKKHHDPRETDENNSENNKNIENKMSITKDSISKLNYALKDGPGGLSLSEKLKMSKGDCLMFFLLNNLRGNLKELFEDLFMAKIFIEIFKACSQPQRLQILKETFPFSEELAQDKQGRLSLSTLLDALDSKIEFDLVKTSIIHKYCFTYAISGTNLIPQFTSKCITKAQSPFIDILNILICHPLCDEAFLRIFWRLKPGRDINRADFQNFDCNPYDFLVSMSFDSGMADLLKYSIEKFSLSGSNAFDPKYYEEHLFNLLSTLISNANLIRELCYNATGSKILIALMKRLSYLDVSYSSPPKMKKLLIYREKLYKVLSKIGYFNIVCNPIGVQVLGSFLETPMRRYVLRNLFGELFTNAKKPRRNKKKSHPIESPETGINNLLQVFKHDNATKFLFKALKTEKDPAVVAQIRAILQPYARYVAPKRMWLEIFDNYEN